MGINIIPAAAAGKTRFVETLLTGVSYTVPAEVFYVNATLIGGGGSGGGPFNNEGMDGKGGQEISTNVVTTPGGTIVYAIGAGGAQSGSGSTNAGGSTTFVGATSAAGGAGGRHGTNTLRGAVGTPAGGKNSSGGGGGGSSSAGGGAGGNGCIILEYWK